MLATLALCLLVPFADVELPADPDAVVIWLDSKGGSMARVREEPWLEIRAGGTLRVQEPWLDTPARTYRIGRDRVRELLAAMVGEHRFLECSSEGIEAALRGNDSGPIVLDAGSAVIGCRVGERRHEVSLYALKFLAREHPEVRPLAALVAIHEMLEREMWVAELGGAAGLAAVLEQVNAELKEKHPGVGPLTEAELAGGSRSADGTTLASFHRSSADGRELLLAAAWRKEPDGEPRVEFWFAPDGSAPDR